MVIGELINSLSLVLALLKISLIHIPIVHHQPALAHNVAIVKVPLQLRPILKNHYALAMH